MDKLILIPIIIGSVLLVTGGIFLGVGIANNKSTQSVTNTYELNDKVFTSLKFDLETADLEFVVSPNGEKKVVCEETNKHVHTVEVVENTLTVNAKDLRKWYETIFDFGIHKQKVTVYLPGDSYDALTIKASTGNLKIPQGLVFENVDVNLSTGTLDFKADVHDALKVTASTGDLWISEASPKTLNIETHTGDQNLSKIHVDGEVHLKASTGDVSLDDVTGKRLDVNTSTGRITLKDTIMVEDMQIKASTGRVTFDKSDAETLNIETSTGHVSGTLLTSKIFQVETSTGKVHVPQSTTGGLCKIKTSTGNVDISVVA